MHVLLNRSHDVPGGGRVRLRLPHGADRAELHRLVGELGLQATDLDAGRALRCAPGERLAVCATAWDGSAERLTGFAAADLRSGRLTVLAPDRGLAGLLERALDEHASAWGRRVA